jgi:dihydroorotase
MHEGYYSTLLGLRGIPAAAEEIMVGRDIALVELTHGRMHLMCVSTKNAVERIRRAKLQALGVTADVAVHHLLLTDELLQDYDANYKVDPPLRTADHVAALIAGLQDGTIDAISSDHQPVAAEKKDRELDLVPFGIVGLETLIPLCIRALIEPGHLTWPQLIAALTTGPARVLGLGDRGALTPGADADVTVIDPEARWTIDPKQFRSRGRNTPFAGSDDRGRGRMVLNGGDVRYRTA